MQSACWGLGGLASRGQVGAVDKPLTCNNGLDVASWLTIKGDARIIEIKASPPLEMSPNNPYSTKSCRQCPDPQKLDCF